MHDVTRGRWLSREQTDCMITQNYEWGYHMVELVALNATRLQFPMNESML